jgi:hypothetical protein
LLEDPDFLFEACGDRPNDGSQNSMLSLSSEFLVDNRNSNVAKIGQQMRAACIQVREVSTVRFVKVIVGFKHWRVCGRYTGKKDQWQRFVSMMD